MLSNKVALITGGASGLGKAIALRLVAEGAHVTISDIQSELGTETALAIGCRFITQDVCNEHRWAEVIDEIEGIHGRLDTLVNNAGILGPKDLFDPENTRLTDWKRVFEINVDSVFLGCRAAIPAMRRAGGGSIINISSVAGLLATPYATAYGASKAAVRQLTKSVAQHCAERKLNIRCNSVHPGVVRTALWENAARAEARMRAVPYEQIVAEGRSYQPMGEFIAPEDIGAAVSFLASDQSRYVTGTKLIVDGGIIHCDTYYMNNKRIVASKPPIDGSVTP